jgi:hypothetical protein
MDEVLAEELAVFPGMDKGPKASPGTGSRIF